MLNEIILTDDHMVPILQGPVQTIDPDFGEKKIQIVTIDSIFTHWALTF